MIKIKHIFRDDCHISSKLTRSGITLNEWITGKVTGTNTHRGMTDGSTFSISTA